MSRSFAFNAHDKVRLLLFQIGAEGSLSRGLTTILRSSDQFTVELSREVVDEEALSDLDRLCGRLSEDPSGLLRPGL